MTGWDPSPAEVVLGGLTGNAPARAEHLIRTDPAYRAEVERLRLAAEAVRLAAAAGPAPVPPPLDLAAALAARPGAWQPRIAETGIPRRHPSGAGGRLRRKGRARSAAGAAAGPRRLSLRPAAAALAACALLAAGVGAGVALDPGGDAGGSGRRAATPLPAPPGRTVALAAYDGFRGAGRVAVRLPAAAGHTATLVADGLAPSPSGHYYELWLLDGGRRVASLGSFRVDRRGHAEVRFPVGVDPRAYRYLDVSVEPDDGDPTHSTRSVLRSAAIT